MNALLRCGLTGTRLFRVLCTVAAITAVGVLGACGGGGGGGPAAPAPAPTPITTTLPTFNFNGLAINEARFTDVQINVNGTLTATANWTFASTDVDIYVTNTSCTGVTATQLNRSTCPLLGRADSRTAKPERLTMNVTRGSVLRVWVANFGPNRESGTLQISVTGTP